MGYTDTYTIGKAQAISEECATKNKKAASMVLGYSAFSSEDLHDRDGGNHARVLSLIAARHEFTNVMDGKRKMLSKQ